MSETPMHPSLVAYNDQARAFQIELAEWRAKADARPGEAQEYLRQQLAGMNPDPLPDLGPMPQPPQMPRPA